MVQWCFAAVSSVAPTPQALDLLGIFAPTHQHLDAEVRKLAAHWLGHLERRLADRTWSARVDDIR